MKKKIYISLFVFVIIIIVVVIIFLFDIKTELNHKTEIESIKSEKLSLELYTNQFIVESVLNNNTTLKDGIKIIELKSVVESCKPKLVYRYSALNCTACIDFGTTKLENYFKDYNSNSDVVVVVSDFPSNYKARSVNFFNIEKSMLGLSIERANLPFYFLLCGNNIRHVFIPDKNFPEYTDAYLKEIKKRYFNP